MSERVRLIPIWDALNMTPERYLEYIAERSRAGIGCCSPSKYMELIALVEERVEGLTV